MSKSPRYTARQKCQECGGVVDPRRAVVYYRDRATLHGRLSTLPGIYCCADCLLDARDRGFPRKILG